MSRHGRRAQTRRSSNNGPGHQGGASNQHPSLPPNAIETLVTMITTGTLDPDLPLLYDTIGERLHAIEAARLANALARLNVGDLVRIAHDVRPLYLHGLTATVIRRGVDTVTIQLDQPVGKFVNGRVRCSPLAVERIGT